MKIKIILGLLLVSLAGNASSASYTESFSVTNGVIADGNPVGSAFSGIVIDIPGTIASLTVGLDVSGGYNGDLYAYLAAPNGAFVLLLNQPGTSVFGAPGSGFSGFTLDDSATAGSIQSAIEPAGVPFSGTYQAAGSLADFNGGNADGTWTLFIADLASGGGTSTLNAWSLEIETVPEPGVAALGVSGAVLGMSVLMRSRRSKR